MAYQLELCKAEDLTPAVMKLIFDAFGGRSQLMNAMHPHVDTPEGLEKTCLRYQNLSKNDYSQRWVKVMVDGEIIGVSQWCIYDGPKPPEVDLDGPPGTWDSADDKEWAQSLYRSLMAYRRPIIRAATGPVICKCNPVRSLR